MLTGRGFPIEYLKVGIHENLKKQLRLYMNRKYIIGACLLSVAAVLAVFWDPLFSGKTLFSPDGPPFFTADYQYQRLVSFWGSWVYRIAGIGGGGRAFHPLEVLAVIFPPLVYHVASYMVSVVLLYIAGVFFLRGRRIPFVPALLGGLAIAFAGYFFTLISAGHRGIFYMMPYAVFVFGFLDRAIDRKSMFYFAMTGAFAGFGLIAQADVMGLLLIVAGAYGVFKLSSSFFANKDTRGVLLTRTILGGFVALLFLGLVCAGWYEKLTETILPKREQQIASAGAKTAEEKWIFATNWSMPPEEILEFVAPGIFGFESGDPAGPYWGRVGRSWQWGKGRQGMVNLKQHTVYLGVLQLLFAFYGLAGVLRRRKGATDVDGGEKAAAGFSIRSCRGEIIFWSVVALVSALLAMGRYFPLYRLFYMLPLASKIRAPIKFIHITELSVAILFAYGLSIFLRHVDLLRGSEKMQGKQIKRQMGVFFVVSGVVGTIFFIACGLAGTFGGIFRDYWEGLGLLGHSDLLIERMQGALAHGGALFLIGAGVFAAGRFMADAKKAGQISLVALLIVVPLDLVNVARNYVRVRDLSAYYAPNPVAEKINEEEQLYRTAYYLTKRHKFDVVWRNFRHHGVYMLNPRNLSDLSENYQNFFKAIGDNIFRLWQLTNTRFVLGPYEGFRKLLGHPAIEMDTRFAIAGGRILVNERGPGQFALIRFNGCLPRALVYHEWEFLEQEAALETLSKPDWNPSRTLLVSDKPEVASSSGEPTQVNITDYARTRVEIETETKTDGILLLNDKYDPDWKASVDGKPAEILRCNYIMRGVAVPAGQHRVVFTYRPFMVPFILSLAVCGLLLAWGGGLYFMAGRKRRRL